MYSKTETKQYEGTGFLQIPHEVIRDRTLTSSAFRVLCWMASNRPSHEFSIRGMATQLGMDDKTIRAAIEQLQDRGLITDRSPVPSPVNRQQYIYTVDLTLSSYVVDGQSSAQNDGHFSARTGSGQSSAQTGAANSPYKSGQSSVQNDGGAANSPYKSGQFSLPKNIQTLEDNITNIASLAVAEGDGGGREGWPSWTAGLDVDNEDQVPSSIEDVEPDLDQSTPSSEPRVNPSEGSTSLATVTDDEVGGVDLVNHSEILSAIAGANTVKDLVDVWREHRSKNLAVDLGWPSPDVYAAAKAREAELKAGSRR